MGKYGTCCSDDSVRDPTPEGIAKIHEALERLGNPAIVDYIAIADAFTPKMANGEPEHDEGHEIFVEAGANITCICLLADALQGCGYVPAPDYETSGNYIKSGPLAGEALQGGPVDRFMRLWGRYVLNNHSDTHLADW
jgi:hypothetical protein